METPKTISDWQLREADPKAYFDMKAKEMMWFLVTGDTAVAPTGATVLSERCTGPNPACRKHHRAGNSVHMIPETLEIMALKRNRKPTPSLLLPTYHFATEVEGLAAINNAWLTATVVHTDADLYAARAAGVPHILRPGWVDPTRR